MISQKLIVAALSMESGNGSVADIIDEMIEKNVKFGGDTVFVHDGELEKFQGLALVTRY